MNRQHSAPLAVFDVQPPASGGVLKWVFTFLLLANIGLWMWNQWIREIPEADAVQARLPIAADKMRLVTEPGVNLKRRVPKPTPAPIMPQLEVPAQGVTTCYRLGPFADAKRTAKAARALAALDVEYIQRHETLKHVVGYRVYLSPLPSKAAAERRRAELTKLGFSDHTVLQEQRGRYAISLGVFSVEVNAQKRLDELGDKRVQARLQSVTQPREIYWFDIQDSDTADTSSDGIIARLQQRDWNTPDAKLTPAVCGEPQEPVTTRVRGTKPAP